MNRYGLLLLSCFLSTQAMAQTPNMPELKSIQLDDVSLAYYEEGEGPLVVLVHGFPDTPYTWVDVRPAMVKAGYRVVTPYLRGYAPSGVPEDAEFTSSEQLGQDILDLIDALGESSAYVVGHDYGASAAYAAATIDPVKVQKLVAVAIPHPDSLDFSLKLAWQARHFVYLSGKRAMKKMQRNDQQHIDVLYKRWAPDWEVPQWQIDAIKESYANDKNLDAALGYYRATGLESNFFETPISTSTLAICGEQDMLRRPEFEAASSHFTGEYQVGCVPGGHWPHRESPDAFIGLLLQFLGEAPGSEG